jgi:hypothetical protein
MVHVMVHVIPVLISYTDDLNRLSIAKSGRKENFNFHLAFLPALTSVLTKTTVLCQSDSPVG